LALAVGDDRLEGAPVRGIDPGAGWVVGERPRDGDGLRRGEREVEPGDGLRRLLGPSEVIDGLSSLARTSTERLLIQQSQLYGIRDGRDRAPAQQHCILTDSAISDDID